MVSAYFAHHSEELSRSFTRMIDEVTLKRCAELIFECDSNSRHGLWGSSTTNERCEYFLDFINRYGLVGSRGRGGFSFEGWSDVIDVSLTNKL